MLGQYLLPEAYAQTSILAGCGPTQGSDLSLRVNVVGFLPNTFLHYVFLRSDNSVASGGFSSGTFGQNTVAINVGTYVGIYRIYIYEDDVNSSNTQQLVYSSTLTLPCKANHFTNEYYRSHPQVIQYLLGIQSIYNKIKIGDYLVASYGNALYVFDLSNLNTTDQLAAQLLAAELNIANGGVSSCIDHTISSANSLLKSQNYNGPNNFPRTTNSEYLSQMLSLKERLEAYNNIGCVN